MATISPGNGNGASPPASIFDLSNLVCVILPEHEHDLRKKMAAEAILAVDPDWNHDQVVQEFRKQQRRTRQIWRDKLPKLALAKAGAWAG